MTRPPDIVMTVDGITYICDLKLASEVLAQDPPVPDEILADRLKVDEALAGGREFIEMIAVTALGRISVDLFQTGNYLPKGLPGTGACPEYDYLIMRDGTVIGYEELAELMANAVRAELEDRAK